MTSISIAKRIDIPLTEQQREVMRDVLFEMFGGFTELDNTNWKRLWTMLMQGVEGEIFTINYKINRDGVYHRRHLLLETKIYESQERFHNFDRFRDLLKVGSGFVDWHTSAGKLVPKPKSIAYDQCGQVEMEEFHRNAIAFLRTRDAQARLWPSMPAQLAEQAVEAILLEFKE